MKTITTTIAILALSIFALSCSKDDETPTPIKPPSAEANFENTTEVDIADATFITIGVNNISIAKSTESNIEVTATGTILDLKKLVLEMNVFHGFQSDLSFTLVAPDGTESLFIKRIGSSANYVNVNKLRFGAAFTNTLSNDNVTLLAGNYKESQGLGAFATPILLPIFQHYKINL